MASFLRCLFSLAALGITDEESLAVRGPVGGQVTELVLFTAATRAWLIANTLVFHDVSFRCLLSLRGVGGGVGVAVGLTVHGLGKLREGRVNGREVNPQCLFKCSHVRV